MSAIADIVSGGRHQPPAGTVAGGCNHHPTQRLPMQNSNRTLGLGMLALTGLVLFYLIWPYLVGALAIVGAVQVWRVWRNRLDR